MIDMYLYTKVIKIARVPFQNLPDFTSLSIKSNSTPPSLGGVFCPFSPPPRHLSLPKIRAIRY